MSSSILIGKPGSLALHLSHALLSVGFACNEIVATLLGKEERIK